MTLDLPIMPLGSRPSPKISDFLQMILGDVAPSLGATNLPPELVQDLADLPESVREQ